MSARRPFLVLTLVLLTSLATLSLGAQPAAATTSVDIASAGPLTHVYLGNELSCQVAHSGDEDLEFYPPGTIPGDCGTFLAVGGTLYAPDFPGHGSTATSGLGARTVFTPVSQTGVMGSGTSADPYRVVTVASVGSTGLTVTQTDGYVVGDESYRTDVQVSNSGGGPVDALLYRAGDCFLANSDTGFGLRDPATGAVGCRESVSGAPGERIEEWLPISAGSHQYEAFFSEVWNWIGTKAAFPDTCECTTDQDNGAGLSWNLTVPAGGSLTRSHITTFSPTGKMPLSTQKTADSSSTPAGGANGYTISISNPNTEAVTLSSIADTLPQGFTYTPGSTTGATTADPAVSGQNLSWSGPFTVPAGGSVSLHFGVTVASASGTYYNDAGGTADGGYSVAPTGPTAPVTVTSGSASADLSVTKTDSPDPVMPGQDVTYHVTVSNAGPDAATNVTATDTIPAGTTYVSATPSQGSCAPSGGTVTCPLGTIASGANATVDIVVTTSSEGTITDTASATASEPDPNSSNNSDSESTTVSLPSAAIRVYGHAHTDHAVRPNGTIEAVHVHLDVADDPSDGLPPSGRFWYYDWDRTPPGGPHADFSCRLKTLTTIVATGPDTAQIDGTVKCLHFPGVRGFRLTVTDNGTNPPNVDRYHLDLFDQTGAVVYDFDASTTLGRGDLTIA